MMQHDKILRVGEALQADGAAAGVVVRGWVRTRRDSRDFFFLEINDGSCLANLQVIVDRNTGAAWTGSAAGAQPAVAFEEAQNGAAVEVTGDLVESPGQGQKWELRAKELKVWGAADQASYPLQKKRHSDEFLRGIAHLRARTNKYGAAFRLRSEIALAVHGFFAGQGFYYMHTPILTGSDCEGAGEMFRVTTLPQGYVPSLQDSAGAFSGDFFGRESSLTVSGQLNGEALALALGRIYTFGPTFRAENSHTARHAAEFWMIEPEAAFFDLEDDMQLGEDLVRHVSRHVLRHSADDLELFNRFVDTGLLRRVEQLAGTDYHRVSYREAVRILAASGKKFEYPVSFGLDLQTEHECFLAEEYFKGPVTVYDYPKSIKAFYMRGNDDGETVAAMDMLAPRIGELIGGSQREERLDRLLERIRELGQNPENYWWYLDLRRYGSAPHAGFGLGFERLVMLLTGISNIRDAIPFPRTPGSLEF